MSSLVWDLIWKSLLVLVTAQVVVVFCRRKSAAVRHAIWLAALGSLLALPVLSFLLPRWEIVPVWSRSTLNLVPTVPANHTPMTASLEAASIFEEQLLSLQTETLVEPAVPVAEMPQPSPSRPAISIWVWIWALGLVVSLLPALAGRLSLHRLERTAQRVRDPVWLDRLKNAARYLGLSREVVLLRSEQRRMPMTWGTVRSRLLLPREAENWREEEASAVLLHELAHIKRWDYATGLFTRCVCAFYWFNPLVWLAARNMAAERERACDDLVLSHGARPSAYARQILQLVSDFSTHRWLHHGAVGMVRGTKLEERLKAILDSARNRSPVSRSFWAAMGFFTGLLVIPLAMLAAEDPKKSPAQENLPSKSLKSEQAKVQPAKEFALSTNLIVPASGPGRFLKLENGKFVDDLPAREPVAYLDKDAKSGGWYLMVENIYNYHTEREEGLKIWETQTPDTAAEPAGLAGVPFERKGFHALKKESLPITVRLPGFGLLQVTEIVEGQNPKASLRIKKVIPISSAGVVDPEIRQQIQQFEQKLKRMAGLRSEGLIGETEIRETQNELELLRARATGNEQDVRRVQVAQARQRLENMAKLHQAGLIGKIDFDRARADYQLSKAELTGDQLERARVQLKKVQDNLQHATDLFNAQLLSEEKVMEARQSYLQASNLLEKVRASTRVHGEADWRSTMSDEMKRRYGLIPSDSKTKAPAESTSTMSDEMKRRYGLVPSTTVRISEARHVVEKWLTAVGADDTKAMWDQTTRESGGAYSVDFQKTWAFKNIKPRHVLGSDVAAMVYSDPYQNNAGRTRVFLAALVRKDGRWLIQQNMDDTPENIYRRVDGFAAHPGVKFEIATDELMGEWLNGGFITSKMILGPDGKGTSRVSRGTDRGDKPFTWEVKGNKFRTQYNESVQEGEIIRLEHDLFVVKFSDGNLAGYHRATKAPAN